MSAPAPEDTFDQYTDPTWDDPEEADPSFGISEVSLEELILPSTPEADLVPTLDDDAETIERTSYGYRLTRGSESFVISGPVNEQAAKTIKGRLMTREQARAWCTETYGDILEEMVLPHRWAFRVWKPTSKFGRYTPPGEN